MSDVAWWGAVTSLGGACIGIAGSLLVQRQAQGQSRREELRFALNDFNRVMERSMRAHQLPEEQRGAASEEMWGCYKNLQLVCSNELAEQANAFCVRVDDALWNDAVEQTPLTHASELNHSFNAAAKQELARTRR